jgi:hypothetical protein
MWSVLIVSTLVVLKWIGVPVSDHPEYVLAPCLGYTLASPSSARWAGAAVGVLVLFVPYLHQYLRVVAVGALQVAGGCAGLAEVLGGVSLGLRLDKSLEAAWVRLAITLAIGWLALCLLAALFLVSSWTFFALLAHVLLMLVLTAHGNHTRRCSSIVVDLLHRAASATSSCGCCFGVLCLCMVSAGYEPCRCLRRELTHLRSVCPAFPGFCAAGLATCSLRSLVVTLIRRITMVRACSPSLSLSISQSRIEQVAAAGVFACTVSSGPIGAVDASSSLLGSISGVLGVAKLGLGPTRHPIISF